MEYDPARPETAPDRPAAAPGAEPSAVRRAAHPHHDRGPHRATAGQDAGSPAAGHAARPGSLKADIRDLELLAHWLDSRFVVPGTKIRFGLDSVLGLVPGVGDAVTTLPAAYMLMRAHGMGVPKSVLARMGWNVVLDLVVGAIPLVGDLFDLGFKANRRNVELLRRHFDLPPQSQQGEPINATL